MAWGNIAWEKQYRDILHKTNFLAKLKSIFSNKELNVSLQFECLITMKQYAIKKMSNSAVKIFCEIIRDQLFIPTPQNQTSSINPFSHPANYTHQLEGVNYALEVLIEMSNQTDIAVEANEFGILLNLNSMLLGCQNLDFDDENGPEMKLELNILTALGGIIWSEENDPINDLLDEGIMDNLFRICDYGRPLSIEKILWVSSNIGSTSEAAAWTVVQTQLYSFAIESLYNDSIDSINIKKEIVYLLVCTFTSLPINYKISIISEAIGKDCTKFLEVIVKSLSENISTHLTVWTMKWIKDIFDTARDHSPLNYNNNFLEDVLDEFNHWGGPETIEVYLEDENEDIQSIAVYLEREYLSEVFHEILDGSDFKALPTKIEF